MRKYIILALLIALPFVLKAQELNAVITVNSDQVGQTNQQIFKTLERSLNDFVNKTKWTNRTYTEVEKLNVRMFVTVTEYQNNRFKASIQLQSSRPVYNTSYESPVFNYKDNQFNFEYTEFQPLVFNENVFESNLVGVVAYYAYIMLGIDADTFEMNGGTDFYRKAQNIVTQAQGSSAAAWSEDTSERTRFELVDKLLPNTFKGFQAGATPGKPTCAACGPSLTKSASWNPYSPSFELVLLSVFGFAICAYPPSAPYWFSGYN